MANGTCIAEYCDKRVVARGRCNKHYMQWWRENERGNPRTVRPARECAADECVTIVGSRNKSGYCGEHFPLSPQRREGHRVNEHNRRLKERTRVVRATCAHEGCEQPLRVNNKSGYCRLHYKFSPMTQERRRAYWMRKDRPCAIPGCESLARTHSGYCAVCENARSIRRKRLRRTGQVECLFEMQDGLCPVADWGGCGLPMSLEDDLQVDHIFPVSLGGPDDESNMQLMHRFCNQSKGDKIVPALRGIEAA